MFSPLGDITLPPALRYLISSFKNCRSDTAHCLKLLDICTSPWFPPRWYTAASAVFGNRHGGLTRTIYGLEADYEEYEHRRTHPRTESYDAGFLSDTAVSTLRSTERGNNERLHEQALGILSRYRFIRPFRKKWRLAPKGDRAIKYDRRERCLSRNGKGRWKGRDHWAVNKMWRPHRTKSWSSPPERCDMRDAIPWISLCSSELRLPLSQLEPTPQRESLNPLISGDFSLSPSQKVLYC